MILQCPHCARKNRIVAQRFNDGPTCGGCGQPLTSGAPITIDGENFSAIVAASQRPVVIDFWAPWCGPCRTFAPVFAQAAARGNELLFAKLDTDANPAVGTQLAIRSIPTLAVFRQGRLVQRVSGALPAAQFEQWLRAAVG